MKQNVTPELSVVIPAYNASKTIIRTLESLTKQTADPESYEIIVVDDGSADDTYAVCCEYAADHSNVKVVHKENGGVSTARNQGISHARGRWVSFVDSDDFVTEDYVDVMCTTAPDADYIIFDHVRQMNGVCSQGKPWLEPWFDRVVEKTQGLMWVCDGRLNAPWDKRFTRALICENDIQFPAGVHTAEDWCFNFQYAWRINSVFVSSRQIYQYVDTPQSLTHKRVGLGKLAEYETIYWEMMKTCGESAYLPTLNRSFLHMITICAGRLHRSEHSRQTIAALLKKSAMVEAVLAAPATSFKDVVRVLLLRLKQYQLCARIFRI